MHIRLAYLFDCFFVLVVINNRQMQITKVMSGTASTTKRTHISSECKWSKQERGRESSGIYPTDIINKRTRRRRKAARRRRAYKCIGLVFLLFFFLRFKISLLKLN